MNVPAAAKTQREKSLEADLKKESDATKRRAMEEELDALRKEREREDARNRAITAEAEEKKRENLREQALAAGSRFNLRYDGGVPGSALTPEAVQTPLAEYVDFTGRSDGVAAADAPATDCGMRAASVQELRKGLTVAEAETLLGRPERSNDRMEGKFRVTASEYTRGESLVQADYVEGVLVRYSISSR